jgi:hypothetical protein
VPGPLPRDVAALIAFLDSRHQVPHAWGRPANDCVGFCLDAVEALTGVAVAPELQWTSRASALRVLRVYGTLEAAFDAHFERVAPAFAHRGDIGFAPPAVTLSGAPATSGPFAFHPVIVEGPTLVGPGETGLRRLPRTAMVTAWSAVRQKAAPPLLAGPSEPAGAGDE